MGNVVIGKFNHARIPFQDQYSGNGGGGGSDIERIATLEANVKNINVTIQRMWDDIRDLSTDIGNLRITIDDNFKWMIVGFVGMAVTTVGAVVLIYDAFKEILIPLIGQ